MDESKKAKGYELIRLPNGKRQKVNRGKVKNEIVWLIKDWQDYIDDNWIRASRKGELFNGESKIKGFLDRMGSLLIEDERKKQETKDELDILTWYGIKRIKDREISVGEFTDELMEKVTKGVGRKRDKLKEYSENNKKIREIKSKYPNCIWYKTSVDTEGIFEDDKKNKYKIEHSDYKKAHTKNGVKIYSEVSVWYLKDKKDQIQGFISEKYKDMTKAVKGLKEE